MTRETLLGLLSESLLELQTNSGLPEPANLTAASRPSDLEEFDSLKCLEFEILLSDKLGFDVENVVIPKDEPGVVRTLGDIADAILARAQDQSAADA